MRFCLLLLLAAAPAAAQFHYPQPEFPQPTDYTRSVREKLASTDTLRLDVVTPWRGHTLSYSVKRMFTFGNVTRGAALSIDGRAVATDADGRFLDFNVFHVGVNTITYTATLGGASTTTVRVVTVADPRPLGDDSKTLDPAGFLPWTDLTLSAGDLLRVQAKGPPGLSGWWRVKGMTRKLPLVEKPGEPGAYEGHWEIQADDDASARRIQYFLARKGGPSYKEFGPAKLSVREPGTYRVAVSSHPATVVKTDAWKGYDFTLPSGVRFKVSGAYGNQTQIELDRGHRAWVDTDRIGFLPDGTPPPLGVLGRDINVEVDSDTVRLVISAGDPVAFDIKARTEPYRFEIRFFNSVHRVNIFWFESFDPVFDAVRWRQDTQGTVVFDVDTKLHWGWGYDAYYRGKDFVLEVRRPPDLRGKKDVLAGRKIALDPGHGPKNNGLGPSGTEEQHMVLEMALALREELRKRGAEVYMTRVSSAGPPLLDRPLDAFRAGAEIFVSLHHNGLWEYQDPFARPRGVMTMYYHEHDLPLARILHRAMVKGSRWADEGVRWADFYVARDAHMPSILAEYGYLILPEHEKELLSVEGQRRAVAAYVDGITRFFETYQKLQRLRPTEGAAAKGRAGGPTELIHAPD